MNELTSDMIPIMFMYGCALLLGPFVAGALYMAFDGDRLRVEEPVEAQEATVPAVARTAPQTRGTTAAA